MPRISIVVGGLLIVFPFVVWAATGFDPEANTALMPVPLGFLIGLCGVLAERGPALRKHMMHAAMLLAVLLIVGSLMPLRTVFSDDPSALKVIAGGGVILICGVYLALGIRSFRQARRNPSLS